MRTRSWINVDRVQLRTAGQKAAKTGLLGWISCRLNDVIELREIMLRRTRSGRPVISFPARRDRQGDRIFFVRPLDDATRQAIEFQILQALGILDDRGADPDIEDYVRPDNNGN